ncbi:hypothetical protein [Parapedobacter deserti]
MTYRHERNRTEDEVDGLAIPGLFADGAAAKRTKHRAAAPVLHSLRLDNP